MTKKEERELNYWKDMYERTCQSYEECLKDNISLRKQLGEFDFKGWNESGVDAVIGNAWHMNWDKYMFEMVLDNALIASDRQEAVTWILEKCFNAGMDYERSKHR